MKKIFAGAIFSLMIAVVFTACFHHHHNISINVTETDDNYEFKAYYDESETGRVQDFINKSMAPNGLFSSTHDYFNVTTSLNDGTSFHVKSSPGEMRIDLDKKQNSAASYQRIKEMCNGIKTILTKR